MARPTKQGIDYFPLDTQFDEKVELFVAENEHAGLGILINIWQLIYAGNGYYINNDKTLHLLIKRRGMSSLETIKQVINSAISYRIFDSELHSRFGILTSRAIQERYFLASKKKKRVSVDGNYLCRGVSVSDNSIIDGGNATNVKEEVNVKEKEDTDVVSDNPKDIEVVEKMAEAVRSISSNGYPDFASKPKLWTNWLKEARLLREKDGRDPEITLSLIAGLRAGEFRKSDSFDWANQIKHPGKFRAENKGGETYWEVLNNERGQKSRGSRPTKSGRSKFERIRKAESKGGGSKASG